MTTPEDTEQRPPEAEWVTIPEPPAENRSEPDISDEDRGRPLGAWVLGGGIAAALGGVGLFQAFGTTGLAAGAVTAAGGGAVYGYHKVRGGRSPLERAAKRARRTPARAMSGGRKGGPKLGLGKGKGPKLGGGKGPKLGGRGGPKLGKGGGPKLGGKSSKLFSGKGAKLGGGKSGKLSGGRGSKLGGKLGRKTTSRLGSVGKSGGKLLGRGGKAGLGKGARGGKLLGGKGKAGVGRWGKSTGAGAGILGRGAKKLGGKTRAAALRTKAGQRAGHGFKAAKSAMHSAAPGKGRWKNMHRAARGAMGSSRNPFARWSASIAAAMAVLTAMGHGRWRAFRSRKNRGKPKSPGYTYWLGGRRPAENAENKADRQPGKPREDERTVDDFTAEDLLTTPEGRLALKKKRLKDMKAAFQKLKDAGDATPEIEAEHMASRQRLEREIAQLRAATGQPAPHPEPSHPTHTRRTDTMQSANFPIHEAAFEMTTAAAHYTPQDMWCVDMDLEQVHDIPLKAAEAIRIYTENLQSAYPIHPTVVEALGRAYIALGQVSTSMAEIPKLFKQAHEDDIKRKTTPRIGEDKWNV